MIGHLFFYLPKFGSRAKHRVIGDFDEQTKRVLILGAGYVSAPVVEYLTRSNDVAVYVGKMALKTISLLFKTIS